MKLLRFLIVGFASASIFGACNDADTTIGSSLVADNTEVVRDSSFAITGHSVDNNSIMSRTVTQLLGKFDVREYGSMSSDVVTQFMCTSSLDTTGVAPSDVDSVKLVLLMGKGDFVGDSLMPMGLKAYRLTKPLPSPIYSSFDPDTYFSKDALMGQTTFTTTQDNSEDNVVQVEMMLPRQFGVDLYNEYLSNPATLQTPTAFTKWFPGLYITNSFGNGRLTQFSSTSICTYYKRHSTVTTDGVTRDTIYNLSATYMAVTPEVITNNNMRYTMSADLRRRITEGEAIITSPAGADVEVEIPINDMLRKYRDEAGKLSVFNTMEIDLPVETISNSLGIDPPKYVLMILSKEKEKFFAENTLPDSRVAFYTTYNPTTKQYVFTGMRQYFLDMLEKFDKDGAVEKEDYTFVITPVEITLTESDSYYQTTPTVSSITPYINGPSMARLRLDQSKIRTVYSKQNIIF